MRKRASGFGLIEVMVYTVLLFLISLAVAGFVFQLLRFNNRSQAHAQVLDDARRAIGVMTYEIRHARSLYNPTSIFSSHPGQLSLETTRQTPANEDSTYIDFYLDSERLYLKREGAPPQLITSPRVRITSLVFTQLAAGTSPPTIRIALTVAPLEGGNHLPVTLYATTSPRSYE